MIYSHKLLAGTLALVLIAGIISPAFAQNAKGTPPIFEDFLSTNVAPDHIEIPDAGNLPATSQDPGGSGSLNSIAGNLGGNDLEDMYEICITDHNAFTAASSAQFDEQLFLFDTNGLGVYSNDDNLVLFAPSLLPSGDPNSPSADGTYYIAISNWDDEPNNPGGLIFVNGVTSVNGPDLAAGGASPILGWNGNDFDDGGSYTIVLTGVSANSSCEDEPVVGGEFLPIDSTALILAGAQTNAVWILSALAVIGSVAFGALYITTKKN